MFNKSYQLRAVRQAGGGRKVAEDALLRLPEPWRPLVTVAAAAEEAFYRPKKRVRPGKAASPHSAMSRQLELPFAIANCQLKIENPADRPLFDLFPEAYE